MNRFRLLALLITALLVTGCQEQQQDQIGEYTAASAISEDGFAKDEEALGQLLDREVKLWGFVDHGNLYGDDGAKAILGQWWSGEGPDTSTWRFNLKANADDETGQSFAVHVPNGPGRDELLQAFVDDARAEEPTQVFVQGRISTFDAPTNATALTGLLVEVASAQDILLEPR